MPPESNQTAFEPKPVDKQAGIAKSPVPVLLGLKPLESETMPGTQLLPAIRSQYLTLPDKYLRPHQ